MKKTFLVGALALGMVGLFSFGLSFDSQEALAGTCKSKGRTTSGGGFACDGRGETPCEYTCPDPEGDGGPDSTPIQ